LGGAGRGKRDGARVSFYWHAPGARVYFVYGYVKNERDDLTPAQMKTLAALMKEIKDG
jgi:hypothetical protein